MSSGQGNLSQWILSVVGSLMFFFFTSASFAQKPGDAEGAIITCPPSIKGLRLNYTTKYTPPTGWGHADAQSRNTKGGVFNNLTLVRNSHELRGRNLICLYGAGSSNSHIKLASIKQLIPKGASCTAESEYRFRCVNTGK